MNYGYGDLGNRQEPVYNSRGEQVGLVVLDGSQWRGCSVDGRRHWEGGSRREVEQAILTWDRQGLGGQARRPVVVTSSPQPDVNLDQVVSAVAMGAALVGGLVALLGANEQPRPATGEAEALRQQNALLQQQNAMLRQALGQLGPKDIVKRK